MAQLFVNNATATLDTAGGGITGSDTSIVLTAGQGSIFPAVVAPDYLVLTMAVGFGGTETAWEIVKVTAHTAASTTLTVVRGQEGTTGLTWIAGTSIQARLTKAALVTIQTAQGLGIITAFQMGLVGN